jgi:hypothetical protein
MFRSATAGMMIPPVGEQDAANIQKQGRNRNVFFHEVGVWRDL